LFRSIDAIDPKTRNAYIKRIKENKIDIELAEESGNPDKVSYLKEENLSLLKELKKYTNKKGKSRKIHSQSDTIRRSVSQSIHRSFKQILECNKEIHLHFKNCLHTGYTLYYCPDFNISWNIS
ncbi:MAG: hypothetical protein M1308_13775, partial [Actinobacteria bacterium]|nr:hypothetical protein [Actinomycetota bacterium]